MKIRMGEVKVEEKEMDEQNREVKVEEKEMVEQNIEVKGTTGLPVARYA